MAGIFSLLADKPLNLILANLMFQMYLYLVKDKYVFLHTSIAYYKNSVSLIIEVTYIFALSGSF